MDGAQREPSVSRVVLSQFHQTLLDGVGGGEPYSEPSQQVEEAEAEVTGESVTNHDRSPMLVWRSQKERPLTLVRKMLKSAKNEKT